MVSFKAVYKTTVCAVLAIIALVSLPITASAESAREAELTDSLDTFCAKWMGFLEQRHRDNKAKMVWRSNAEGVQGEFVGYHDKYTCSLSALKPDTRVPVGTIKYLELKIRHRGASTTEALQARPKVLEATEVMEIFRYSKNKWVY